VRRRIAVTGARGFIGGHVAEHLAARGDTVAAVVVRAPCDHRALVKAFEGADAVVHLAGVVSAVRDDRFITGNVDATRGVAAAARAAGARLVHVSSLAAAGPAPASAPRTEDDPAAPITPYGRSKLEGERVVGDTSGLRWTILRPGVVYGPRDRGLLPLFRYAARGLLPLTGRDGAAYMFIHITDVVRAIAAAIDRELDGETIFVAHAAPVHPRELLTLIRAATNPRARLVPIPRTLLYLAALVGDVGGSLAGHPLAINRSRYRELTSEGFVCRVDKLRDRLGIVANVDLAEGIRGVAEWYRNAGWL
jgi:dihydroflavonol-4-reductase